MQIPNRKTFLEINDILRECDLKTARELLAEEERSSEPRPSVLQRIKSRIMMLKIIQFRSELNNRKEIFK